MILQISADSVFSMNLGFFITLVGIIISGVMAVFRFNNRFKDKENSIDNIQKELNTNSILYERAIDNLEKDFREKLQEYQSLFESEQGNLKASIDRVENKLDKLISGLNNFKCSCK